MSNENETMAEKAEEVKETVAEKAEDVKEAAEEKAEDAGDKAKDVMENIKEEATEAMHTVGGFLKKAGEAAVNMAEKATGKDLDKDGTIGG